MTPIYILAVIAYLVAGLCSAYFMMKKYSRNNTVESEDIVSCFGLNAFLWPLLLFIVGCAYVVDVHEGLTGRIAKHFNKRSSK